MFRTAMLALVLPVFATAALGTSRADDPPAGEKQKRDPEAMFKRFDANGDGKIVSDELPEPRREVMLKNLDTDGDQAISRDEFAAGAPALARRASEAGELVRGRLGQGEQRPGAGGAGRLSAALDSDGDGELSSEEIAAAAESLKKLDRNGDGRLDKKELGAGRPGLLDSANGAPKRPGAAGLKSRALAADKNGDGKLSREEAPERLQRAFDKIDANADGLLDEEELRAGFEKVRQKVQAKPVKAQREDE